jgi:hypothetical protein
MITPRLTEHSLDVLFAAGLLCEVCEMRVATQKAQWSATDLCASCAEAEPQPEDERDRQDAPAAPGETHHR